MKLSRIALASALTCGLWFGTESAQHTLLEAMSAAAALEAQGAEAVKMHIKAGGGGGSTGFELPPMYQVKDGVGVLSIDGPLITGSAGWMRLFGVVGYDDIRQAADEMVALKSVKSVMLHINSPGGMAAGCEDCAAHLKALSAVKPTMTYSDTVMASGGYWLGSVGKPIMAGGTAMLGSVGVLITHVDVSKANENAGRKVTVIRAGEHKQLANPNEPLSDKGKAHLEGLGEQMYSVFSENVASNLGVSVEKFDKTMGRGREFMGQQAVDAGLAKQVATFDQAFAFAKTLDGSNSTVQNPRNPKKDPTMKATLSVAYLMKLFAGSGIASLDFAKPEAAMSGETPDVESQQLLRAQAIEIAAGVKDATGEAIKAATDPLNVKVTELQASLSTVNTELGALRTTNAALVDQTKKLEGEVASSDEIVHASLSAMSVALSLSAPKAVTELKGPELLAEHKRVAADFAKKFPSARVSAVLSGDPAKDEKKSTDIPMFAQVAAKARQ